VLAAALGVAAPALAQQQPAAPAPPPPAQPPTRAITQIKGDLYRFQNNFHYSVFLVTPKGVIVTDPINADAAKWLKEEIAKRFNQPIRYLIYSHDHWDHINGGEVFADTATVVAHANARIHIINEKRATAVPDVTFTDRMVIELGGKTVELLYFGKNHSDNSIVMHFPAERTAFVVDWVSVNRLPWRTFQNSWIDETIESLKKLEAMDFDILAPGHGAMGTRADVGAHRKYVEELRAQVLARVQAKMPLAQVKTEVTMPAYAAWGNYKDWLELNVEGMYAHMSNNRIGNPN
jgi:glyoxylase-like metal-dependent hydrolase (beta-lactamase superfamily II)